VDIMLESRHQFRANLADLDLKVLGAMSMAIGELDRALDAIIDQDMALAEIVLAGDVRIDQRYLEIHRGLMALLARQTPVAGDLRLVTALLHVSRCIERMGDQCANIAKLVPLCAREQPTDRELLELTEQMGQLTRALARQARDAFRDRDVPLARELVREHVRVGRCNRAIFNRAVEIGDDLVLREWAMFMILVARAIERIAGNTVDIAEQTAFIVTGVLPEVAAAGRA
jgi:phosphate transport system protein